MKFGFVLPNNFGIQNPNAIVELAVQAEELGLHSVFVNHHIVNVGYIHDRLGDLPYHDALTILSWVGARTDTIKLGTSVLVMPYLHPMVTAKALATIDQLSDGRVIAGLGVGSLAEENEILGSPWADRGAWSNEFIEVMVALWKDGPANYAGNHWSMSDVVASPNPLQDSIPLWIGGSGAPARRRTATYGTGWHPMLSVGGLAERMPDMRKQLADADREILGELIVAPRIDVRQVPDHAAVKAWEAAGADELIVGVNSGDLTVLRESLHHVAALNAAIS